VARFGLTQPPSTDDLQLMIMPAQRAGNRWRSETAWAWSRVWWRVNTELWRLEGLEDRARSTRCPAFEIVAVKRPIDAANAERHVLIDALDEQLGYRPGPDAHVIHSQTVGELSDRLTILELKIEKSLSLMGNAGFDPATRSPAGDRGKSPPTLTRPHRSLLGEPLGRRGRRLCGPAAPTRVQNVQRSAAQPSLPSGGHDHRV